MKLQFKHQKFQSDAAKMVVDVFAGQPYLTPSYMMDRGSIEHEQIGTGEDNFTGWGNQKIVPELNDRIVLENIQKLQRKNQIEPSSKQKVGIILRLKWRQGIML